MSDPIRAYFAAHDTPEEQAFRALLAECRVALIAEYAAADEPLPHSSVLGQQAMQRAGELREARGLAAPEPSAAETARADALIAALREGRLPPPE